MRDPKRIEKVLAVVAQFWRQHPDLRLAQLISNAGAVAGMGNDPFNLEDEELIRLLRQGTL